MVREKTLAIPCMAQEAIASSLLTGWYELERASIDVIGVCKEILIHWPLQKLSTDIRFPNLAMKKKECKKIERATVLSNTRFCTP